MYFIFGRKIVREEVYFSRGVAIVQRHSCEFRRRTTAAADTILTSTPSFTSRVLGCLSHMT